VLDCTGCRNTQVLFELTQILLEFKFLSDVTGCRKTRVSDCTGSTVVVYVTSMYPNCHLKYKPDFTLCILCRPLIGFIASNTLNYLAFQSFDFEHT
jgi:hypothetical protein